MTETRTCAPRAEIAGAGIGGLASAVGLAMNGWIVTVHERAPDLRTFGAGIYIWSNGLRVLEALGAYEKATLGAHVGPVMEMRDHRNRVTEIIPINGPGQARLITILRETLLRSLVERCRELGVKIRTGSEVVGAQPEGVLLLADGSERTADLVIGADGINSQVRDSLGLLQYRKKLGYGAIRLMIARAENDLPAADRDKYIEYFTGSRRILYTPSSETDLYIALCCAADDAAAQQLPPDHALWTRDFPWLESVVRRFDASGRWDAFEVIRLKSWSAGRVAIVGDGAHAMPPYLGQGGGTALMNALSLAEAVSTHAGTIEERLAAWEASERPLTEHTQEQSERLGDMNFWPDALRAEVMALTGKSTELADLRMRTARHVPVGSDPAADL